MAREPIIVEEDIEGPEALSRVRNKRGPFKKFALPEPRSAVGKQGVAGVTDVATSLPALPALAYAGVRGGLDTLPSENKTTDDNTFFQNFMARLNESLPKKLMDTSTDARRFVNDTLGIQEPKTAGEQIARIATSSYIPGIGPLAPVATATNKAAAAARIATPLVKLTGQGLGVINTGNILRMGTQVGLGTGVDQFVRSELDDPELPTIAQALGYGDPPSTSQPTMIIEEDIDEPDAEEWRELDRKVQKNADQENARSWAMGISAAALIIAAAKYRKYKLDLDIEKQSEQGITRQPDSRLDKAILNIGNANLTDAPSVIYNETKVAGKRLKESMVDKSSAIANALRGQGFDKNIVNHVVANSNIDPTTMAVQVASDGVFGQGTSVKTVPINDITLRRMALSPEKQSLFDTAMTAATERTNRVMAEAFDVLKKDTDAETVTIPGLQEAFDSNDLAEVRRLISENRGLVNSVRSETRRTGTDPVTGEPIYETSVPEIAPGMWSKNGQPIPTSELDVRVQRAYDDPEVNALMKDVSQVLDDHLKFQVERGFLSKEAADQFRRRFTMDGRLNYLPLFENNGATSWARMGEMFGIHTRKGQEMSFMAEMSSRGLEHGSGVKNPISTLQALQRYNYHSIEAVNENALQWNVLSRLANVDGVSGNGGLEINYVNGPARTVAHTARQIRDAQDSSFRGVRYIGKAIRQEGTSDYPIQYADDPFIKQRLNTAHDHTVKDLKNAVGDDVLWVQRNGELHGFLVEDPFIRTALSYSNDMTNGMLFANHWKRLFTQFTTGNLSVFSPASFAFNTQQALLLTTSREGLAAGAKAVPRSAVGAWKVFSEGTARDISNYLAQRIATHTGIAKVAPNAVSNAQQRMQRVVERSLLNEVRRETGRLASGNLAAKEFTGDLTDVLKDFSPNFAKHFGMGEMHLLWRMWKNFNTAMHEGPGFAAMMSKMDREAMANMTEAKKAQHIRDAVEFSRQIVGDVKRRGASKASDYFHASVPFSGAMVQAWRTIASTAKDNPVRFTAAVGTVVGLPTAMEMVYNRSLDVSDENGVIPTWKDAQGREWTYNDYYWNGFTEEQRVGNSIYMIPGKPPWEAVIVPVFPEWGLARALTLELMDEAFNFSDVGESGLTGINGAQTWAALHRVLDIPIPPPLAALFSSQGIDLRVGAMEDVNTSPDAPGHDVSFFRAIPAGQGERATSRFGFSRYAGQIIDKNTAAVVQDILGAGGATMIQVAEAFNAGKNQPDGDLSRGIEFGSDAFTTSVHRQSKIFTPLWGKSLRPNTDTQITRELLLKRNNLKRLSMNAKEYMSGALGTADKPMPGSGIAPSDDPITLKLSESAKTLMGNVSLLDDEIATYRKRIESLGNSHMDRLSGRRLTVAERDERIDGYKTHINTLKAQQLAVVTKFEQQISEWLSTYYGRDIDINLSTYSSRPNLPEGETGIEGIMHGMPR